MKRLVKFTCCNTEHLFTRLREFKMCECGKSGFDAGDGYYTRGIGTIEFEKKKEETKPLFLCADCGELSECDWKCDHCEGDDLEEYVEE